MSNRIEMVFRLLNDYPSMATDLLMDYCRQEDVRLRILERFESPPERNPYGQAHSPPTRLDTTFESQHKSTGFNSRNLNPPDIHRALPRQVLPNVALDLPLSPARTASVTSHSTAPDSSGRESIFLLSCGKDDDDSTEQQAYCRSAPIGHNLITDAAANSRAQKAIKLLPEEVDILVPNSTGKFVQAKARYKADIVWRRRKIYKTARTSFYIVPASYLDTDIIFTLEEAAIGIQYSPDYQDTFGANTQLDRGFVEEELDFKAPAPRSVTSPHSQFDAFRHFRHLSQDVQPQLELVDNLASRQRMRFSAEEDLQMRYGSAVHTASVPKVAPIDIDSGQRHHMATSAGVAVGDQEHNSSLGQIRLTGRWGSIPINLKMDLNAPGEVFYQTFCRWAEERGRKIERERTILWLKRDKNMRDELRFDFCLSEEELEEVWEAVIEWVQENKREKGPHVYVEVKTGTE